MADILTNPVKEVNTKTPVEPVKISPTEKKATANIGNLLKEDNNSEEATPTSDQVDSSEVIENNSSGSVTTKTQDQISIESVKKVFKEPFKKFGPKAYLEEFYKKIDPTKFETISQAIEEIKTAEKSKNGQDVSTIDLNKLKELLSSKGLELSEEETTTLENYAIYDFLFSEAIPQILKYKPDDHLKVLDVGGGPTIYQHLPLIGISDSIVHSEYLSDNRDEVEDFLNNKSEFDWHSYSILAQRYLSQYLPNIEANEEVMKVLGSLSKETDPNVIEDRVRSLIKKVVPVDVFKKDLGLENSDSYDLTNVSKEGSVELCTSNFCVESATADRATWEEGMKNIGKTVNPGGFLLMTAIRNADWYKVGNETMPAVPVDISDITKNLEEQGFEIIESSELIGSDQQEVGYDGMVFILARKIPQQ